MQITVDIHALLYVLRTTFLNRIFFIYFIVFCKTMNDSNVILLHIIHIFVSLIYIVVDRALSNVKVSKTNPIYALGIHVRMTSILNRI